MLSAEMFLREASDELKTPVSPEALSRVAEVGAQFSTPAVPQPDNGAASEGSRRERAFEGVLGWLRSRYPEHSVNSGTRPALLLTRGESHVQADVLPVRRRQNFARLRLTVAEMISTAQFVNLDLV